MKFLLCVLFVCFAVAAISQTCDVKTLSYTDIIATDSFTVNAKSLSGIKGSLSVNKGTGSASIEFQRGQGYVATVAKGLITINRVITSAASQLSGANFFVTLVLAAVALFSQRGSLAALAIVLAIATVALAACATVSTVNVTVVVDQALLKSFVYQVKVNPTTNACPTDITVTGTLMAEVAQSTAAGICSYTFTNSLFGCPNTCGDITANVQGTSCVSGVCTLTCNTGFQACNNNCDTASNAVASCGTCTNNCANSVLNANTTLCVAGACDYDACAPGFADCDGVRSNGCEPAATIGACGSCSNNCSALPGINASSAACDNSSFACSFLCAAGFLDCNASAPGCEATATLDTSCGSCTNDCTVLTGTNAASASCNTSASACSYTCSTGFSDCTPALGCETSIDSNAANCGTCGNDCSALPNVDVTTTTCTAGACVIGCQAGFADCDHLSANGCEVATLTNNSACGSCSNDCVVLPNVNISATACSSGQCSTVCLDGFANCGTGVNVGCPDNTNTSATNCGACRNSCTGVLNAVKACSAGICGYTSCLAGFNDCNNDTTDGCETSIQDVANCLTCKNNCGVSGPSGNFQTTTCSGSPLACGLTCSSGFSNCDSNYLNGCEVNTNANVSQCGKCNNACSLLNTANYTCNVGICQAAICASPYAVCTLSPTLGCTINTNTDAANCGSCGAAPCSGLLNVLNSITCASGVCQTAANCASNFNDCDGLVSTGCETPSNRCIPTGAKVNGQTCSSAQGYTNPSFIGLDCSTLTGTKNVVNSTCDITSAATAGTCLLTCATGFSDCDKDPTNGCEAVVTLCSSTLTVGSGCQTALTDPQSPVSCLALKTDPIINQTVTQVGTTNICDNVAGLHGGKCIYTCGANYFDCDNSAKNGCEVDKRKCPTNSAADCVFNNNSRCGSVCTNCLTLSGTQPGTAFCNQTSLQCQFNCPVAFCKDADGLSTNGCEQAQGYVSIPGLTVIDCSKDIDLTNVLSTGPILCDGNSTSATAGRCLFTCKLGFSDCDGNPKNGCETAIGPNSPCHSCAFQADISCGKNKCVDCTLLEGTLGSDYANGRWASVSASSCLPVNASVNVRVTDWYCDTSVHRLNPRFDPPDSFNGACQSELCRDLDGDWSNGCESAQQYGRGRFYYYGDSTNTDSYLVPYVPNPYEDRFYEYKAAFTAFPDSAPTTYLNPIYQDIKLLTNIQSGSYSTLSLTNLYWHSSTMSLIGRVSGQTSFTPSSFSISYSAVTISGHTLSPSVSISGRETFLLHYAANKFTDVNTPAKAAAISILGSAYLTPIDCVLSEWSDWGLCSYADDCIKRNYFLMTRIRTRKVSVPASGGGVCHLPLVEDFYRFSHRNSDPNAFGFTGGALDGFPIVTTNAGSDYQHGGGFSTRVDYTKSIFNPADGFKIGNVLFTGPQDWSFDSLLTPVSSISSFSTNDAKLLSWTGNELGYANTLIPSNVNANTTADRAIGSTPPYGALLTCAPQGSCPNVNSGIPKTPCNITTWSQWSVCSATCDGDWAGGVRIRTRTVIQGARFNGDCFQTEFDTNGLPLSLYGANAGMLYEEDWQCNDHSCASYDCNTLKAPAFAAANHIYLGADAIEPQCDGRDWPEYVNGISWVDVNRDGLDDNAGYMLRGSNVYPVSGNFPLWNTVYNLSYEFRWPGHCLFECEEGWFDCDHNPNNGCETNGDFCSIDAEYGSTAQLTHPILPWMHPHGDCTIAWKHDATGVIARDCNNFYQINPELINTNGLCTPATGLCDLTCSTGFSNCNGDGCVDITSNGDSGYCGTHCVDCTQLNLFKYGYSNGWSCAADGDDYSCKPTGSCNTGCSDEDGNVYNGCETAVYEQWPYPDVTPMATQMDGWSQWSVCSRSDDCGYLWDMSSGANVFRNVPLQTRYRRPTSSAYNGGLYPEFSYRGYGELRSDNITFPSMNVFTLLLTSTPALENVLGVPLVQTPFYEVRVCPNAVTPCIECTNQLEGMEMHCSLSSWTNWSACSAECADRIIDLQGADVLTATKFLPWDQTNTYQVVNRIPFQIRTRSVVTPASLGGRCPPPLDTWQQAEAASHVVLSTISGKAGFSLIDSFEANLLISAKASFLVDVRKCNTDPCQYPEDCDALNYWYPGHFASIATCGTTAGAIFSGKRSVELSSPFNSFVYGSPVAACFAFTGYSNFVGTALTSCDASNGYCDQVNTDLRDGCDTFVYPTHCGRPNIYSGSCDYDNFYDCTTLPGVVTPFGAPCVADPTIAATSVQTFAESNPSSTFSHVCDIRWACNTTGCTSENYGTYQSAADLWKDGCEVARNYMYPFVTVSTTYPYGGGTGNPMSMFYGMATANTASEGSVNSKTFHDPRNKYTLSATANPSDNSIVFDFDCHGFLLSHYSCGTDGIMEPVEYSTGLNYPVNAGCHLGGAATSDRFNDLGFGCNGVWNTPQYGMCVMNCAANYVDADLDPRNGCETDLIVTATPEDHYVWVGNCNANKNGGVDIATDVSCGADECVDCTALPGTLSTGISGTDRPSCHLVEEIENKVPVLSTNDYYSIQYACGVYTGYPYYHGDVKFNTIFCDSNFCADGDGKWQNGCEQGRGYTGGGYYFLGTVYDTLFDNADYTVTPPASCNPDLGTSTTTSPTTTSPTPTPTSAALKYCDRRSIGFEFPHPGASFFQNYTNLSNDPNHLGTMIYPIGLISTYLSKLNALNSVLTSNSIPTTTAVAMLNNRAFDCSLLYSTDLVYGLVAGGPQPEDVFAKYRFYGAGSPLALFTYGYVHHINVSVYPTGGSNNVCNRLTGLCNFVCLSGWDDYDLDPSNGCEADLSGPCGSPSAIIPKRYTVTGSCGGDCVDCKLLPGAYNLPLHKSECLPILPAYFAIPQKFSTQLKNGRFVHACSTEVIIPVNPAPNNYYFVDAWKSIVCDPLSCYDGDYEYQNGCETAVDYPFGWYNKAAWDHYYSPIASTISVDGFTHTTQESTYWVRDDGLVTIWTSTKPNTGPEDYWFSLFNLDAFTFQSWDVRTITSYSTYSWFNWSAENSAPSVATYSFSASGTRGNNIFPYTGVTSSWDCSDSVVPSGTLVKTIGTLTMNLAVTINYTLTTHMAGPWFHVNQSVASQCNPGPDPGAISQSYYGATPSIIPTTYCTPSPSTWNNAEYNKGCYDSWVYPGSGRCKLNCETNWADGDSDPSNGCESYLKNGLPFPASVCGAPFFKDPATDHNFPNSHYNYNQNSACGAGLCLSCQSLGGVNHDAQFSDASVVPAGMLAKCIDGGDDWFGAEHSGAVKYPENTNSAPVTSTGLPSSFTNNVKYPGDYYCSGVINENACLRLRLPIRCNNKLPPANCGIDGNVYPSLNGGRQTTFSTAAYIIVCADHDDAWETGCEVALGYNLDISTMGPSSVTSVLTSTGSTISLQGIYKRSVGVKPYYDGNFAVITWASIGAGFDCETLRHLPRAHTHITPQTDSNTIIECAKSGTRALPGQCSFVCDAGWIDCDGNPWNGCEQSNLLCGGNSPGNSGCEQAQNYPALNQANFACVDLAPAYANKEFTRVPFCDGNQLPYDDWHIFYANNNIGSNTNDASQYDDRFEIEDKGIDAVTITTTYVNPVVSRYTIKGYWDNADIDYVCRVWLSGSALRTNLPLDANFATGRCTVDCRHAGGWSNCDNLDSNGCESHINSFSCRSTAGLCVNCQNLPGAVSAFSSTCLSTNSTGGPITQFVINFASHDVGLVPNTNSYVVSYGTAGALPPISLEFPQCDTRGSTGACDDSLCRDYDGDWENGCEFPMKYNSTLMLMWETPSALYSGPIGTTNTASFIKVNGFDCSWVSDPQPDAGGRNYGGKTWADKYHVNTNVSNGGSLGYCVGKSGAPNSGQCDLKCIAGWTDCDRDPTNGCENDNTLCAQCVIALGYPDNADVNCSTLVDTSKGFVSFTNAPSCNGREGENGQCSYYFCNIFAGFCDSGLGAVLNFATGQGSGCVNQSNIADNTNCGADWNWRDMRGNMSTVSYDASTADYEGGRMLDYSNFDGTGRCASCDDLNGYVSASAVCMKDQTVAGHTYDHVTYYKPAASGFISNSLGHIQFETAGNTVGDYLCQLHAALDSGDDGACNRNLCVDEDYYWANGCETAVNYPAELLVHGEASDQRHLSVDGSALFGFDYHFAYNDVNFGREWPFNPSVNSKAQVSNVPRSEVRGIWCPFLQFWSLSTDNYLTGDCDVFPCPHFHPDTVNSWISCVNNATDVNAGKCNFQCNVADGWKDCDANPLTGCEIDIFSDGTCGSGCEQANCNTLAGINPFYWSYCISNAGVSKCDLSVCEPTLCMDKDSNWTTGCETAMNYPGNKSYNCLALQAPAELARLHLATVEPCNGEPGHHLAGKCEFTCEGGWIDCDGDFANGCEHDGSLCQDCTKALGYVTNFDGANHWEFFGSASNSSDMFYSVVYGSYFDQNTRMLSSFALKNDSFADSVGLLHDQFSGPNVAFSKYHDSYVAAFDCTELRTTYPGQFDVSNISCDSDITSPTAGRCIYACNAAAGYYDCDGDPRNGCEHFSQHSACGRNGACRNCYYMSGVDYPVDLNGDGINDGSMGPYQKGAFGVVSAGAKTYGDVYAEVNVTYFGLDTSIDLRSFPDANVSPLRLGCTRDPVSSEFTCNLNTCTTTVNKLCSNDNQQFAYGWKDGCETAHAYLFNSSVGGATFDCSSMGPDVSKGDAPRPTNIPMTPSFHVRQVVGTFGCDSHAVNYPTTNALSIYNGRGAWRYVLARLGRSDIDSLTTVNETSGVYAFDYAGLSDYFTVNTMLTSGQYLNNLVPTVPDFVLFRVRGSDKPGTCYYECEYGYEDCNGDPRDGCEIKVSACIDGDGLIGWDYVAGMPTNGCEVALGYTVTQLGLNAGTSTAFTCLQVIGKVGVNTTMPIYCRGGQDGNLAQLGTCQFTCLDGYQDCDGNPNNGCEALKGNQSCSCVSCTNYLPGTLAVVGSPYTSSSVCSTNNTCTLPCNPLLCVDADGDWTNGCETAVNYPTPRNSTAIGSWDCSIWAKHPLIAKKDHIDMTKLPQIFCKGRTTDTDQGTCTYQAACVQRSNGGIFDYQDCNSDPRDGCEDASLYCSRGLSATGPTPRGTLNDLCSKSQKYSPWDCVNTNIQVNTTVLLPYCDRNPLHIETRGECVFNCNTGFADCNNLPQDGCEANVSKDSTCNYDCVDCKILPGVDRTAPLSCVADIIPGQYKCQFTCIGGSSATSCADRDGKWQNGCETALNGDNDLEGIFVNLGDPMDCSVMHEEAKKNPELFRHHLHIDLTVSIPTSVDTIPAGSIFCNSLITAGSAANGKCYFACIPGFNNLDRASYNGCEAANVAPATIYPYTYGGYLIGDYMFEKHIATLIARLTASDFSITYPVNLKTMPTETSLLYSSSVSKQIIWY